MTIEGTSEQASRPAGLSRQNMAVEADGLRRARALEAYEAIPSLDHHGELTRLILAEVSLLTDKYRNVRRHEVPHIQELAGLLDVLWQEVEMELAAPAHPVS